MKRLLFVTLCVLMIPTALAQKQYASVLGIEMGKTTISDVLEILNKNNLQVNATDEYIVFYGHFKWQGLNMRSGMLMFRQDTIYLGMYCNTYDNIELGKQIISQAQEIFNQYPQINGSLMNFFEQLDSSPNCALWTQDAPLGLYMAAKQNMLQVYTYDRRMLISFLREQGVVIDEPSQKIIENDFAPEKESVEVSLDVEKYAKPIPDNQLVYTTTDSTILDSLRLDAFDVHLVSHTYEDGCGVVLFDTLLTVIGDSAFFGANIKTLVLPDSLKEIGAAAFGNCVELDSIFIMTPTPPMVDTLSFSHYNTTLLIPCDYLDQYTAHEVWGKFPILCYKYASETPCKTTYSEETVTACDSYRWYNRNLLNSGVYTHRIIDKNGCIHQKKLYLTIECCETKYSEETVTACDSYQWYGRNLTNSGVYDHRIVDENGCVHQKKLYLTIECCETKYSEETVTACDSYQWYGRNLTNSGVYDHRIVDENGCTYQITLYLTIVSDEPEDIHEEEIPSEPEDLNEEQNHDEPEGVIEVQVKEREDNEVEITFEVIEEMDSVILQDTIMDIPIPPKTAEGLLPMDQIIEQLDTQGHHYHNYPFRLYAITDYCDYHIKDEITALYEGASPFYLWNGLPVNFARIVGCNESLDSDSIVSKSVWGVYVRFLPKSMGGRRLLEHYKYLQLFNELKETYNSVDSVPDPYAKKLIEILRREYTPQYDLWCSVSDDISYYVFLYDEMFFALVYNRKEFEKIYDLSNVLDILSLPDPYVYH